MRSSNPATGTHASGSKRADGWSGCAVGDTDGHTNCHVRRRMVHHRPYRLFTGASDTRPGTREDTWTAVPAHRWASCSWCCLCIGFGWALLGHADAHSAAALSSFGTSLSVSADYAAAQAQPSPRVPALEMPEPMTNYVGRRVNAFGLRVTSVDADEGFWVEKDGRTAWTRS